MVTSPAILQADPQDRKIIYDIFNDSMIAKIRHIEAIAKVLEVSP
jgi:hypothetical protein